MTDHDDDSAFDERVLVVAPTRRDADVTGSLLRAARVPFVICADMRELAEQLGLGVGAVLVTDQSLGEAGASAFVSALGRQPAWSDVPVLVLTRGRENSPASVPALGLLTNVTLLDRPVSMRSMVSAVQASLRARRRQYQMRDQLRVQHQAEEALKDADRRKDEFLATLSHELRNPLAPIRTGLQVLGQCPDDPVRAAALCGMMERQLDQLVDLVDDLLDLSRISTGRIVLRLGQVDLRDIARAAVEATAPLFQAAGHELRVDLWADPVMVRADSSRLTQVIGNLLNNAVKYTPKGGMITLEVRRDGDVATACVTDNGAGIPPEMIDSVFEIFTQVDRTLDRSQGGLGIGLSLVRRLMSLHGGSVDARSEGVERGSTFTIRLPLSPGEGADGSRALRPEAPPIPTRSLRILVVDDDVDAADSLAIQLESSGHRTRAAYSGIEALRIAAEFAPGIVFCDIGMPGMDGHEVASALRVNPLAASTILVALTGWGSEEDKRRTRAAGFDFHLVKPVSLRTLAEVLSRL